MSSQVEVPSGYAATDDYIGVGHRQHELRLVAVQVPWPHLIKMVKLPDPDVDTDYNRPLRTGHAERFGEYLDVVDKPYTPPIALWTDPSNVLIEDIDGLPEIGNIRFVIAKFVRSGRDQVNILDGQHRIYGCHLLFDKYQKSIGNARDHLARAEALGEPNLVAEARAHLKKAKDKLPRLEDMVVTVQIALTGDKRVAKQIFADVADNALGISKSILSEFSLRSAFNRSAQHVADDTLPGLVDTVQDRMSRKNPHWLSLKDVVNVVQALQLPLGRRWTHKLEAELKDQPITRQVTAFFEGLFDAFPELKSVREGETPASELRATGTQVSLLGSATMIRVLAAAYRTLSNGDEAHEPMSHEDIMAFFSTLPMEAGSTDPDDEDADPKLSSVWVETGKFAHPYTSPSARLGDIRVLANDIAQWAQAGRG